MEVTGEQETREDYHRERRGEPRRVAAEDLIAVQVTANFL